jgi:hypothetical protein
MIGYPHQRDLMEVPSSCENTVENCWDIDLDTVLDEFVAYTKDNGIKFTDCQASGKTTYKLAGAPRG